MDRLERRSSAFLKFVPFKEPESRNGEMLADDAEISEFDTSDYVFTDISYDATNQDRLVAVRQTDGKLRTATPEEHGRMNRMFYEQPERPVMEPPIFNLQGEALQAALEKDEHEFVLDWAVHFYEPDDPKFVELCKHIFDRAVEAGKLDVLHSTRHFGTLAFYLLINGRMSALLQFYAAQMKSIDGAADTIRLWRVLFPNWATTVASDDSSLKVVEDFLNLLNSTKADEPAEIGRIVKEDIGAEVLDALRELVDSVKRPSSSEPPPETPQKMAQSSGF